MNVSRKYGVVRAIAFVLKLFSWLALLGGIVVAIVTLTATSGLAATAPNLVQLVRSIGVVMGPLIGIIWFVQLYAFGSVLSLLIDIEENTRVLASQPPAYSAPVDVA